MTQSTSGGAVMILREPAMYYMPLMSVSGVILLPKLSLSHAYKEWAGSSTYWYDFDGVMMAHSSGSYQTE